jgi:hypothetical protein
VHRHLVMFASLFLFLWAAISIGCSGKSAEESSDSSAPFSKSASLFGPKEVTLPAGTVITVRLASAVGSKTSNTGDHFNATIATPVESGGKVVLPKGAEVLRVHRGEGDCPPRRVRPHLHTHRTRHRQDVTIVLSESPASTKKPPHGRLFHRKFQTTPRNLRDL